jgi:pilus assembly protein CpaE
MMPEMSGQEFIRIVRSDPLMSDMPIILLTGSDDMETKIAGFEAGTDDYLVKPVNPTELELRVKALLARAKASNTHQQQRVAKTITVFSLRGGVGTTSVAVNLATALAQLWTVEVPLLDLALKSGHCAMMLNLKPRYTLSFLHDWETPTVDVETIDQLLLRHKSGVRLLPAPFSPVEAELITPTVIDRVWPFLRASYPFMVIDGGSQFNETMLTILERSQVIVLMLAPDLASIKATVDAMHIFEQLGYTETAQILPVINHTFASGGILQKNIEATLRQEIAGVIPHDNPGFVRAINSGEPLFSKDPTSQTSLAIATLAYQLSSAEMAHQTSNPSKLLTWVSRLAKAA